MKLMTWNIRLGIQEGLDPIADVLETEAPDIVALQEVGRRWVMGPPGDTTTLLAEKSGFPHAFFTPSLAWYPPAQYGHALLSKWPIQCARIFSLPQKIDEARTALIARIAIPDRPLHVVSTHLSHVDDRPAQGDSLASLVEELDREGNEVVVMGDLNETQSTKAWMARLWAVCTPAPDKSPTYPSTAPEHRIDWIASNVGVWDSAEVLETSEISDHLPVVAQLVL